MNTVQLDYVIHTYTFTFYSKLTCVVLTLFTMSEPPAVTLLFYWFSNGHVTSNPPVLWLGIFVVILSSTKNVPANLHECE